MLLWRSASLQFLVSATTRQAPLHKVMKISSMHASKESDANWNVLLEGVTSIWPRQLPIKFASELCSTTTPFGRPVVPDVKMTYAASDGWARGTRAWPDSNS